MLGVLGVIGLGLGQSIELCVASLTAPIRKFAAVDLGRNIQALEEYGSTTSRDQLLRELQVWLVLIYTLLISIHVPQHPRDNPNLYNAKLQALIADCYFDWTALSPSTQTDILCLMIHIALAYDVGGAKCSSTVGGPYIIAESYIKMGAVISLS